MKARAAVGVLLVLLAVTGIGVGVWLVLRGVRTMKLEGTTDEAKLKDTVRGALDSWTGYFVLDSPEMARRLRAAGYRLDWTDDGGDFAGRFQGLAEGKYDVVAATVDSYVKNGKAHGYPGSIVAVVDESKGDAIVAKDAIKDVNGLDAPDVRIAFTPSSPSEFLLKAVGAHFGVPKLRTPGPWRVETTGSEQALKLLVEGKVEAAVLWEPDVSTARAKPGLHYLMGSDKTRRLIVDVLVARRDFLAEKPEVMQVILREYFLALKAYRDKPDKLLADAALRAKRPPEVMKTALDGVAFASFTENCEQWMGVPTAPGGSADEGLVEAIEATVSVFTDDGDFTGSPLPEGNPYAIMATKTLGTLVESGLASGGRFTVPGAPAETSAPADVPPLPEAAWKDLRTVGALKIRPIVFQSGTSMLTTEGKNSVDATAENLKHYPNFRVVLRGHTAPGGDDEANRVLSLERAESVARYLEVVHKLDPDRVKSEGLGGTEPLAQEPGEGERAYRYRLPRVEFVLLAEVI